ncbi:HNH endonuclease signature motif containing protein [Tessaracoccus sp. ZS01]|uniref:HNH endonuclease signature motif containing protein n=1 Tax=Tessaracoccus sp. ZS01 TaxID=1906324 RepID=UPI00096E51E9|nr:HNH endonuclease signature motif containing protein [Tessaracoccus sp. ZS01]MCG6566066.1 HNH endonuclease [Tessaracoccus sp. ZS01]OMG58573.1 hypothetical protein BJN44_00245 [Tessaracoccus sp. ZS01]
MEIGQHPAVEALSAVDALLSGIDVEALASCPEVELVNVMRSARRLRSRIDALACVVTDHVNRRQASMKAVGTPTTSLIALDENLDNRQAAGQVALAGDMVRHEAPKQAALDGTISAQQAAAISKGIADLPELPAEIMAKVAETFVARAAGVPARKLARLAPDVLAAVAPQHALRDEDSLQRVERQRANAVKNRRFTWGNDGEGSIWFTGQLPELEAEPWIRTLSAMVAADKRAERDQEQAARHGQINARTRRALTRPDRQRTPAQRNADALITLFGEPATRTPLGDEPTVQLSAHSDAVRAEGVACPRDRGSRSPRAQIRVTISLADLLDRAGAGGVLDSGTELTPGQLRRLAAEAEIIPFVLGGSSEILDMGRASRLVMPAQRRALELRDGGCVFPTCTKTPEECDAHHTNPWNLGGKTNLRELVLLCGHHHNIVEPDVNGRRDQWKIQFDPMTGTPEVLPPERFNGPRRV